MLREKATKCLALQRTIKQAAKQIVALFPWRCRGSGRVTSDDRETCQKLFARECFATVCPAVCKYAELIDAGESGKYLGFENARFEFGEPDDALRGVGSTQFGANFARRERNAELRQGSAHNECGARLEAILSQAGGHTHVRVCVDTYAVAGAVIPHTRHKCARLPISDSKYHMPDSGVRGLAAGKQRQPKTVVQHVRASSHGRAKRDGFSWTH